MKIRPVGAELLHADRRTDGRTDMTKLIVAFLSFTNAPKNCQFIRKHYVPRSLSVTSHSSISCSVLTYQSAAKV